MKTMSEVVASLAIGLIGCACGAGLLIFASYIFN